MNANQTFWSESTALIPADETLMLIRRWQSEGDVEARNLVVSSNIRFVKKVAGEYLHRGLTLGELVSAGSVGLLTAADKFNPDRGLRFISYAVWWVRQAIKEELRRDTKIAMIPSSHVTALRVLQQHEDEEAKNLGRLPTDHEVDQITDITPRATELARSANRSDAYLDAPVDPDDPKGKQHITNLVVGSGEPDIDGERVSRALAEGIATLPERRQAILRRYYGLDGHAPATLDEIGRQYRLTRERIRQLKKKALETLRECEGITDTHAA